MEYDEELIKAMEMVGYYIEERIDKMDKKIFEMRVDLLKKMDDYIYALGDEDIFEPWLMCGVPDCASEDDYIFIALEDETFVGVCDLFAKLTHKGWATRPKTKRIEICLDKGDWD